MFIEAHFSPCQHKITIMFMQLAAATFVKNLTKKKSETEKLNTYQAHFGVSPEVTSKLWDLINNNEGKDLKVRPTHLLWALFFLKSYDTEETMSSRIDVSRKTVRKWLEEVLLRLHDAKDKVVSQQILFLELLFLD